MMELAKVDCIVKVEIYETKAIKVKNDDTLNQSGVWVWNIESYKKKYDRSY